MTFRMAGVYFSAAPAGAAVTAVAVVTAPSDAATMTAEMTAPRHDRPRDRIGAHYPARDSPDGFVRRRTSRSRTPRMFLSPSHIDPSLDSRSVSFENPTGARGAGGQTYNGRKGRPSATIGAGETLVLADLDGPGTLRHLWMTFPPAPPETMRGALDGGVLRRCHGAQCVGALPRLLRDAARTPGAVRVGADVGAGRSRLQLVSPDAVRTARACRGDQRGSHADAPLLPVRLHARARAARR